MDNSWVIGNETQVCRGERRKTRAGTNTQGGRQNTRKIETQIYMNRALAMALTGSSKGTVN